ncbi:hypothetical protein CEXT_436741 [Caerostris extrusa]|uniref:Uncharacterized protein n=1 Tax=Caerostris extrusa TaxID=172846 RepID=A0AAV4THZ1_CAEEX|nr:hypothetical protein CEXT_436741 [Caerostris extrusa]
MLFTKLCSQFLSQNSFPETILFQKILKILPSRLQRKPRELYQSEEPKASESQTGLSIECAKSPKNKQRGEVDKDAVLSYLPRSLI